jgi:hypothetical protein
VTGNGYEADCKDRIKTGSGKKKSPQASPKGQGKRMEVTCKGSGKSQTGLNPEIFSRYMTDGNQARKSREEVSH